MKIKTLKTFVSGRFSANRGEVLEVPDKTGEKLVKIGVAEAAGASDKAETPSADKTPAKTTKRTSAAKSGAKTSTKK